MRGNCRGANPDCFAFFFLFCILLGCGRSLASDLALVGAKIYPSPTEEPIERGSILIHDGRIVAVVPKDRRKMFHKQLGSANEVALTFHHPMMALQTNHRNANDEATKQD